MKQPKLVTVQMQIIPGGNLPDDKVEEHLKRDWRTAGGSSQSHQLLRVAAATRLLGWQCCWSVSEHGVQSPQQKQNAIRYTGQRSTATR